MKVLFQHKSVNEIADLLTLEPLSEETLIQAARKNTNHSAEILSWFYETLEGESISILEQVDEEELFNLVNAKANLMKGENDRGFCVVM